MDVPQARSELQYSHFQHFGISCQFELPAKTQISNEEWWKKMKGNLFSNEFDGFEQYQIDKRALELCVTHLEKSK